MMKNNKIVYLDNNATTAVAPEVLEVMMPFFHEKYANPSSMHSFGGKNHKYIDIARCQVAEFLNAKPTEIFFTSSGTESDNMAVRSFCDRYGDRARLITSVVEHPAILSTTEYMFRKSVPLFNVVVDNKGLIDLEKFKEINVDNHTLASIMWANNETGVIFPIKELAEIVKSKGGFMHSDAVQAAGKIKLDMQDTPVDILSISGHKLHAPKGVGVIYIREGTNIPPFLIGGHQEGGMRAGTENVAFIAALGKACELAGQRMEEENIRIKAMRDRLEKELLEKCTGAVLNGDKEQRLPNTLNISFEYIEGEAVLLLLDENNIAASSGSACTSGSLEPSHVMRSMGLPYTLAHSSTRFSFSAYNNEEDVDRVVEVMPGIVERLRSISPFVN